MNNDIRNFGAANQPTRIRNDQPIQQRLTHYGTVGQKTNLKTGQPVQKKIGSYGVANAKTKMPPMPPIQRKITRYESPQVAKKQRAKRADHDADQDPVDRLDEQAAENDDEHWFSDDDVAAEQPDSEPEVEFSSSPEPSPFAVADQSPENAEYAFSALDANQRPIVPDGWVDTTRADKSEVIAAAQEQAAQYGVAVEPGPYGMHLTSRAFFPPGTAVAPYRGVKMDLEASENLSEAYDKILELADGKTVLVGDIQNPRKPSIASFADDPGYLWNDKVRKQSNVPIKQRGNCSFVEYDDGMWLVAERQIKEGENITVNYGDDYWLNTDPVIARQYFHTEEFYQQKLAQRSMKGRRSRNSRKG